MGIISWIAMGLIVGLLARWLMPGKDPGGLLITIGIGILGAFVGGQPCDCVEDRMVLDGGGDDAAPGRVGVSAGPEDALDGQVVAVGAAGGHDHLRRARAQSGREAFPGLLQPPAGGPARGVQ